MGCLVAVLAAAPAGARFVDAILAEVGGATVAASDVVLARALGLFGLEPSEAPITAADVERYASAQLLVREAGELGIQVAPEEVEAAWQAAALRVGGPAALDAWLEAVAVEPSWPRRLLEAELRRQRFVDLRFRAFAIPSETEVSAALAPGSRDDAAARARVRETLREAAVERSLGAWLEEARARVPIRRLFDDGTPVPPPFPMPRP